MKSVRCRDVVEMFTKDARENSCSDNVVGIKLLRMRRKIILLTAAAIWPSGQHISPRAPRAPRSQQDDAWEAKLLGRPIRDPFLNHGQFPSWEAQLRPPLSHMGPIWPGLVGIRLVKIPTRTIGAYT